MKTLFFPILLTSCTDYDFKNLEDSPVGGDDSDTPAESNGETSSEETEEETDDPEDPNNESPDDDEDCTESYVTFDIDEVSTLQVNPVDGFSVTAIDTKESPSASKTPSKSSIESRSISRNNSPAPEQAQQASEAVKSSLS